MVVGKCQSLGGAEVRKHKRHLPAKLGPERVDDALELGAIRSARQKHLHNRRLLADDVEAAIARLTGQYHDGHDGGDHHRSGDEQHYSSPLTALPSNHRLLSRRFTTLPHPIFPCLGAPLP
jgi:hypothetical protein